MIPKDWEPQIDHRRISSIAFLKLQSMFGEQKKGAVISID